MPPPASAELLMNSQRVTVGEELLMPMPPAAAPPSLSEKTQS